MGASLQIYCPRIVEAMNAGLFISPHEWIHRKRRINSYELILVREGLVKMFEENESFEVSPGETLLLFPDRIHGGTERFCGKLSFYWLHFRLVGSAPLNGRVLQIPKHARPAHGERLYVLFKQYINDYETGQLDSLKAELLILQMLDEITLSGTGTSSDNDLADHVFHYIGEHFREPLSTQTIARRMQRNPDYLGRCFKKSYGLTITDEINRRRVKTAHDLLLKSTGNISEIAAECGFNDTGYFRRLFMRKYGTTPRKYRRLYSRIKINTV